MKIFMKKIEENKIFSFSISPIKFRGKRLKFELISKLFKSY